MRRRGMVLEEAVQGALRLAMFCGLLGTLLQVQAGMDWAKSQVAGGRVRDRGPSDDPCNQLPSPAVLKKCDLRVRVDVDALESAARKSGRVPYPPNARDSVWDNFYRVG